MKRAGMSTRQFLAALPALPSFARLDVAPLGSAALARRVDALPPGLRTGIALLRHALWPERFGPAEIPGAALPPAGREIVAVQDRIRTALAALRARRLGMDVAAWAAGVPGATAARIARGAGRSGFGLVEEVAWLGAAEAMMSAGDWEGVERLRLGLLWERLDRIALGHHFDEAAVLVAVTRHDMAIMRAAWNGDAAGRRIVATAGRALAHV